MSRFGKLVGQNQQIKKVYALIEKAAAVDVPVFIVGETGTGKELVAREIHERSCRKQHPFVALNIGAVPNTLVASTLFGHEKGSFTGAHDSHIGCFREAEEGTLFLDEATTMDQKAQITLLRVLESSQYRPVGGKKEFNTNARILAAANQDPNISVKNNDFRIDLLHRLQVVRINIPPLRDRRSDIPHLIKFFLKEVNNLYQQNIDEVTKEAMDCLKKYEWPGNIRELRNVIYQASLMSDSEIIEVEDLPQHIQETDGNEVLLEANHAYNHAMAFSQTLTTNGRNETTPLDGMHFGQRDGVFFPVGLSLDEVQKTYLNKTLNICNNNKTMASKLLGVSRKTIYSKLKYYGMES